MPKRKSTGKAAPQKPRKQKGGRGIERILVPLITLFLAVPLLAAAVASQTPLTLPDFKLEWPGALAPKPAAPPTARPPAATKAPVAAPPRQEPTPTVAATRAAAVAATPTARSAPTAAATAAPSPTAGGKIVLKVPIYHQQHALSCEAASLRMALATFGLQLPEDNLLAKLAVDPTPRKLVGDTVQWGDPDVGFVGKWDGVYLQDGYGVYEEPIAELGMSYGFEATQYGKNADPKQLYASVRDGFPSVVWMPYDLTVKGRGAWTTPAGKRVPYVVTEHAVVLAGIDATGVYYADPMKPDLQFAAFSAFEKAIGELQGRYVTLRP